VNSPLPGNGSSLVMGAQAQSPERHSSVFEESAFRRMISLERKRSERSRKPFLLMLLDAGHAQATGKTAPILNCVLEALSESVRETDVIGWYEENAVVGVMFTEIGGDDRPFIVSTVMNRMTSALRDRLTAERFRQVSISFHLFPDDLQQDSPVPKMGALYPDLAQRDQARKLLTALKRAMDVAGSLAALVVLSPLFLVIAIAVKRSSPGPVFFRQWRIGQHGVPFVFLKFRSMKVGSDSSIHQHYVTRLIAGQADPQPADGNGEKVYKLTRDPRITKVGAFLRRTSLDELPQFFNVLTGKMSLVGPRPPIPYEVEAYDLWHRRRLLEAKPGITGLWQVNGRSRIKFDDMVRLDLRYARTWSLWMDIKILLRTPGAIFGEGAY